MSKYHEYASVEKLPPLPDYIRPIRYVGEDTQNVQAIVVAGLSLIGNRGSICRTVSVISPDDEFGDLYGWSLCLGDPNYPQPEEPYYFRVSIAADRSTARGTELPNTIIYFQAEVDRELASKEVDAKKL